MNWKCKRFGIAVAAAVTASTIVGGGISAAAPETSIASSLTKHRVGYEPMTGLFCDFETKGDWVHISSTAPKAASAHGWWNNIDCNADRAHVTVRLQFRRTVGGWEDIGFVGSEDVLSGGGSANRANARVMCANDDLTDWRSVVDVDVIGIADWPDKLYTPERELPCGAPTGD